MKFMTQVCEFQKMAVISVTVRDRVILNLFSVPLGYTNVYYATFPKNFQIFNIGGHFENLRFSENVQYLSNHKRQSDFDLNLGHTLTVLYNFSQIFQIFNIGGHFENLRFSENVQYLSNRKT